MQRAAIPKHSQEVNENYMTDGTEDRIIGGTDVTIEEFPYQVAISVMGFHTCGGALISPVHVLTAAHCAVS